MHGSDYFNRKDFFRRDGVKISRRRWDGKDICSHDEGDDELGGLVAERALLVSSFRLNMRMLGRC